MTHFPQRIQHTAEQSLSPTYYERNKITSGWNPVMGKKFIQHISHLAKGLVELKVSEFDNLAIFSPNKAECLVAEFATYANRAVSIPIYATSSVDQVEYITNEAEVRVVFVGTQKQYSIARTVQLKSKYIKTLIALDSEVSFDAHDTTSIFFSDLLTQGEYSVADKIVEARRSAIQSDDLCSIMYTSGTTGEPKGVMITYENVNAEIKLLHERLKDDIKPNDTALSFLPMTHVLEKMWSYYCLINGISIYINENPAEIQQVIKEVRPTLMCSVPRFWEKVYAAVQDKLANSKGLSKAIISSALRVGMKYHYDVKAKGEKVSLLLALRYKLSDTFVFKKLRKTIGVDRGNFFPCAGAPISPTILQFMRSVGINLLTGYGLTEVTGAATSCRPQFYNKNTVGKPLNEVQIKIGENDEILIKGPIVMKGYYKKPKETAATFIDGWFKTGDAGKIDENGILTITERLKDLYKTANGKYIAPQALESKIGEDRFIDQVAVIGDKQKYVTAIIIPAIEALKEYAHKKQIQFHTIEELLKHTSIIEMFEERLARLQSNFASFEQIKRFTLLPQPFTMECGELTNTLKLRRAVILSRYSNVIEHMYR